MPFPLHLQEVWACWCELLSYLEQENKFLDQLEQKLDEIENLQGGAEELQEALDVSTFYFSLRCKRQIGVSHNHKNPTSAFFTSPSFNTPHQDNTLSNRCCPGLISGPNCCQTTIGYNSISLPMAPRVLFGLFCGPVDFNYSLSLFFCLCLQLGKILQHLIPKMLWHITAMFSNFCLSYHF